MKHIMFFCIPAYGHHNPTLPVVKVLTDRGNRVRYYSFEEFREKIENVGAEFVPCDAYLPEITKEQEQALKNVSVTEMTIVDLQTTARMDGFLKEQLEEFRPDVIVTDSVCFWGKLTARKYKIPMVVSTTTFAFNKYSSRYMKSDFGEIKDLLLGSRKIRKELKKLEEYGYYEKSIMPLVRNDNDVDTIVYATRKYQPFSETFSGHYAFTGPSLFTKDKPEKENERPLVYISLGTVINEKPDFYEKCVEAFRDESVEVIISCGKSVNAEHWNKMAENITFYQTVDQLKVLSKANVFLTHCGMNSVSESLYMAAPMVTYPQTNEQRAVERRACEMGAALKLRDDSPAGIKKAVMAVLENREFAAHARECSNDFRQASGPLAAAEFIETAPHIL